MARFDRFGNVLLVLMAPLVLAWTLLSFWRLFRTGTLLVRDHGGIVESSGGFNFWVTLGLYAILLPGSLLVLGTFASWLVRRIGSPGK